MSNCCNEHDDEMEWALSFSVDDLLRMLNEGEPAPLTRGVPVFDNYNPARVKPVKKRDD